eukprot:6363898-Amphidinium_carterae.1
MPASPAGGPWGWDMLAVTTTRPMAQALQEVLMPTAAKMGRTARRLAQLLVEELKSAYSAAPRVLEARA